jgi:hypothetical protein
MSHPHAFIYSRSSSVSLSLLVSFSSSKIVPNSLSESFPSDSCLKYDSQSLASVVQGVVGSSSGIKNASHPDSERRNRSSRNRPSCGCRFTNRSKSCTGVCVMIPNTMADLIDFRKYTANVCMPEWSPATATGWSEIVATKFGNSFRVVREKV